MAHAFNLSTPGGKRQVDLRVQGQPGLGRVPEQSELHRETLAGVGEKLQELVHIRPCVKHATHIKKQQ